MRIIRIFGESLGPVSTPRPPPSGEQLFAEQFLYQTDGNPDDVTPFGPADPYWGTYGQPQYWTVPEGVTSISVDVMGAASSGADNFHHPGGEGRVVGDGLAVTPGEILQINVGGKGGVSQDLGSIGKVLGGWNGGGDTGTQIIQPGGLWDGSVPGAGASDIRRFPYGLADRLVVGGGGGGAGPFHAVDGDFSQAGYPNGHDGQAYAEIIPPGSVGEGGTQGAGGAGFEAGSFGQGGAGETGDPVLYPPGPLPPPGIYQYPGSGGGGGWYGGGGGYRYELALDPDSPGGFPISDAFRVGGAGGGSSYVGTLTNVQLSSTSASLHGQVFVIYTLGVPVEARGTSAAGPNEIRVTPSSEIESIKFDKT